MNANNDDANRVEAANEAIANNAANRKEYMRELMRKKRAAEKVKRESVEDRCGEVGISGVEKEAVVEAILGGSDVVTSDTETVVTDRTPTDKLFEDLTPGYWIYGKEVKERKCWQCGKSYETRLELNKFCGPKCKEKWLSDAFGKLKGVKNES